MVFIIRDIDIMKKFPNACKDEYGRFRVGAAVGSNEKERIEAAQKRIEELRKLISEWTKR